jgi:RHS repeat-associated protein
MVYDQQDRVIMTQDANLRTAKSSSFSAQGWMFTKYDKFGRVVYTGFYPSADTRTTVQNYVNALSANPGNNEARTSASFSSDGMDIFYSQDAFPSAGIKVLTVNYYDTYPVYSFNPAFPATVMGKSIITDAQNAPISTKALPTMSLVKNIEDNNWTKSYVYYDDKARAVSSYSINHLGGYTKTESELDFAGVVKQTKTYHKRLDTDTEKVISQVFEYDPQNRVKKVWHQVNSQPQELLAENSYNELSQLVGKRVGNNLQSIEYTYDVRGALTKVNDPANLGTKLFGYELKYFNPENAGSSTGKYNGNIAEVTWKTATDGVKRRYNYQYDALNRLKKGIYSEPEASVPPNNFYNESVTYDMNSNILSLQRYTKGSAGTASQMDDLTYTYTGNRLNSVKDGSANYSGYPDTSGIAISYDANGNMKDHKDKGILQIDYNFLNLPKYIKFNEYITTRGGAIYVNTTYTYRADGTKLRKEYNYKVGANFTLSKKTTDYLDGFQYETENNVLALKFVPTAEGYYDFEKNQYIYSYTDHLGNIRVSYFKNTNGSAEVLEENNFYPFGMKHEGYNQTAGNPAYSYQYNSKELQKETGWSDYGARMYMSDIARWGVIDPLAEKMRRYSPYTYAYNNPISFIDPDGRKPVSPGEEFQMRAPEGGMAMYFANGGKGDRASLMNFIGLQDHIGEMFDYMESARGGGGGGISSTNDGNGVTMTGIYAQMLFQFITNNITATGTLNIKGFHFVMEEVTPNIYKHTLNAFLNGKSSILHYDADLKRRAERRKEATGAYPTRPGMHKDEYPYASTFEGGKGAMMAYVPATENLSQGGSLSLMYQAAKLDTGDAFMVIPVPRGSTKERVKQDALQKIQAPEPVVVSPSFARPAVPYKMWPVLTAVGVAVGAYYILKNIPAIP